MWDLQECIPHINCNHTVCSLPVTIISMVINHFVNVSKIWLGLNINVHLQEKSNHLRSRVAQIFQQSRSQLKIIGSRRATQSEFHTEDPQILGATKQNLVMVTWHLGFVHPWLIQMVRLTFIWIIGSHLHATGHWAVELAQNLHFFDELIKKLDLMSCRFKCPHRIFSKDITWNFRRFCNMPLSQRNPHSSSIT